MSKNSLEFTAKEKIIKKKNPWSSSTFSQYAGQSTYGFQQLHDEVKQKAGDLQSA